MIACISPVGCNVDETLNTLKYANQAKEIKNKAKVFYFHARTLAHALPRANAHEQNARARM
jgi:hypothetical protein